MCIPIPHFIISFELMKTIEFNDIYCFFLDNFLIHLKLLFSVAESPAIAKIIGDDFILK